MDTNRTYKSKSQMITAFRNTRMMISTCVLMLLSVCISYAQTSQWTSQVDEIQYLSKKYNPLSVGDVHLLRDQDFDYIESGVDPRLTRTQHIRLGFGIDPTSKDLPKVHQNITLVLKVGIQAPDQSYNYTNHSLTIDYQEDYEESFRWLKEIAVENEGQVSLEIASVTDNVSGNALSTLPPYYFVEALILGRESYDFDANLSFGPNIVHTYESSSNSLFIRWQAMEGVTEYQLEWTHVDNHPGELEDPLLPASALSVDFRNNATRIAITNNEFRVPVLYPEGYIVYRVRACGEQAAGGHACTGWSRGDLVSDLSTLAQRFEVTEAMIDHQKSWQYNIDFAENGLNKLGLGYYDGLLRNRQNLTRMNADDEVVVGETVYDHLGRAAVNILPAPLYQEDGLGYHPGLHVYNNPDNQNPPEEFTWRAFAQDATTGCFPNALPLSTSTGSSQYYSENNPDKEGVQAYVPNADGYPYTQTVFEPDNTGRVRNQSGVGYYHRIGSGHETRYFYSKPSQEELNAILGTDAGYADHYQKQAVRDANGQVSVTYLDIAGQTVATALSGETPKIDSTENDQLQPLGSQNVINRTTRHITTLGVGTPQQTKRGTYISDDKRSTAVSFPKTFTSSSTMTLDYQVQEEIYNDACMLTQCYDCVYDLELDVLDECNNSILANPIQTQIGNFPVAGQEVSCESNGAFIPQNITEAITPGTYTIKKTLTVDEDALDIYWEQYKESGCLKTLAEFQAKAEEDIDIDDCKRTCQSCLDGLGDQASFLAEDPNHTVGLYKKLKEECEEPCRLNTFCESAYELMLGDVSPGGQYGEYLDQEGAFNPNAHILSVYNPVNYLPGNIDGMGFWKIPTYLNAYDETAYVFVVKQEDGTYLPEADENDLTLVDINTNLYKVEPNKLTNVEDFIRLFDPEWAEQLVPFHPEYAYYLQCSDASQTLSHDFDKQIRYDKYDTGMFPYQQQFVDDPVGEDPYFNSFGTGDMENYLKTIATAMMQGQLANYQGSGISMYMFAAASASCKNLHAGDGTLADITNCLGSVAQDKDYINEESRYIAFVSLYIDAKQKIQQKIIDIRALGREFVYADPWTETYCGCIGEENFDADAHGYIKYEKALLGLRTKTVFDDGFYASDHRYCNFITASFYKYKTRRFEGLGTTGDEEEENELTAAGQELQDLLDREQYLGEYQMYINYGECPVAIYVEQLLNAIAFSDELTIASVNLSEYGEFNRGLYEALGGSANSLDPFTLQKTIETGTDLELVFYNDGTVTTEKIHLTTIDGQVINWSEVEGFRKIGTVSTTGNTTNIVITAKYDDDSDPATDPTDLALTGTIDGLGLQACSFEQDVCDPLATAVDLRVFLNDLIYRDLFESTSLNIDDNVHMLGAFGPTYPNGWDYTWEFYQNVGGVKSYRITYSSIPATDYLILNLETTLNFDTEVKRIIAIKHRDLGGTPGGFTLVVKDVNDNLVEIDGTLGAPNGNALFNCRTPEEMQCEGLEFQNLNGLKDQLMEKLIGPAKTLPAPTPPGPIQSWLLREYVNFTNTSLEAHFGREEYVVYEQLTGEGDDKDVLLWRIEPYGVSQTATPCTLSLRIIQEGDPAIDFTVDAQGLVQLNSITNIMAVDSPDGYSESYEFTADGELYDDTEVKLRGETCFPIKNCNPCIGATKVDIVNGDIENGSEGNLAYTSPGMYTITDEFVPFNKTMALVGSGDFLVTSWHFPPCPSPNGGGITLDEIIYWQKLDVVAGKKYKIDFDYWFYYELESNRSSQIDIVVDGQSFYLDVQEDRDWRGHGVTWTATTTGEVDFQIKRTITEGCSSHSDYIAIDNIRSEDCGTFDIDPVYFDSWELEDFYPCEEFLISVTQHNAGVWYREYLRDEEQKFKAAYRDKCLNTAEELTISYTDKEHHYTLYHYDQAGNLVRTTPPKAVTPEDDLLVLDAMSSARDQGTQQVPVHNADLSSHYRYNSLNQLVWQKTPDGGESQFWYDQLGRLVLSQNAQQAFEGAFQYSYTIYDDLGRITEVGELNHVAGGVCVLLDPVTCEGQIDYDAYLVWLTSSTRQDVTRTVYDEPAPYIPVSAVNLTQENLYNRVSASYYIRNLTGPGDDYDQATAYSYDIHGNVSSLVQHVRKLPLNVIDDPVNPTNSVNLIGDDWLIKRIDYEYDLISGNVLQVSYQAGEPDAYYHRYEYDGDNRIVRVFTSKEGYRWEQDARYEYYKHGPLARVELGEDKVQGMDYAYTIQGWIKSMNSSTLGQGRDIGHDGVAGKSTVTSQVDVSNLHSEIPQDEIGYSLGYFVGDYAGIGNGTASSNFAHTPVTGTNALNISLYNGNISHMNTAIRSLNEPENNQPDKGINSYFYKYDQLNRIVNAQKGIGLAVSSNTWINEAPSDAFKTDYVYDANGNIESLKRYNQNGDLMDDLVYHDVDENANNQLAWVEDLQNDAGRGVNDIESQLAGNYDYDKIGNLIQDTKEEIAAIHWNVSGKVEHVERTAQSTQPDLYFSYDALGNRVSKVVVPNDGGDPTATLYLRDAQGNVMANYKVDVDLANLPAGFDYNRMLSSQSFTMYGSSRLGEHAFGALLKDDIGTSIAVDQSVSRGSKGYEQSNHLGNVLAVISDRKGTDREDVYTQDFASFDAANWASTSVNMTHNPTSQQLDIQTDMVDQDVILTINGVELNTEYRLQVNLESTASEDLELTVYDASNTMIYQTVKTNSGFIYLDFTSLNSSTISVQWRRVSSAPFTYFYSLDDLRLSENRPEYEAVVMNVSDYYPFGSQMEGRIEGGDYRYGFNGKELDVEGLGGSGTTYDYGFRVYNPNIAKFLSVDPLSAKYAMISPYQYAMNRPIDGIDLDGLEWTTSHAWSDPITEDTQKGKALIKTLTDAGVYSQGMTYADAWEYRSVAILERIYASGVINDCFNTAVKAVIEYAAFYELPFRIQDHKAPNIEKDEKTGEEKKVYDPTFDNEESTGFTYKNDAGETIKIGWGEWAKFADAVGHYYGAGDANGNTNLTAKASDDWDDLKAGDLLVNSGHVTTIIEIDFDMFSNDYWLIQGNLDENNKAVTVQKVEREEFTLKNQGLKPKKWNFKAFDRKILLKRKEEAEKAQKSKGKG